MEIHLKAGSCWQNSVTLFAEHSSGEENATVVIEIRPYVTKLSSILSLHILKNLHIFLLKLAHDHMSNKATFFQL